MKCRAHCTIEFDCEDATMVDAVEIIHAEIETLYQDSQHITKGRVHLIEPVGVNV